MGEIQNLIQPTISNEKNVKLTKTPRWNMELVTLLVFICDIWFDLTCVIFTGKRVLVTLWEFKIKDLYKCLIVL